MSGLNRDAYLTNVLQELAESELLSDKDISKYSQILERIFHQKNSTELYRTPYTNVYKVISLIDKGGLENCSNENLITNITLILSKYKEHEFNVKPAIIKLADHINLDISRLNYTKEIICNGDEYASLKTTSLENRFNTISEKMKEYEKEFKNIQNQYIAILGIFASILLAFVGSITFSTSVLKYMKDVSIYRLTGVGLLVGWVSFVLIWTLLYFITTLVKNNANKKTFMGIFWLITSIFALGFIIVLGLKFQLTPCSFIKNFLNFFRS